MNQFLFEGRSLVGIVSSIIRQDDLKVSYSRLDWERMFALAMDPDKARAYRAQSAPEREDTCTMCGKMCAIRNMNKLLRGEIVDIMEED
mgnify:CR=1 FL=1